MNDALYELGGAAHDAAIALHRFQYERQAAAPQLELPVNMGVAMDYARALDARIRTDAIEKSPEDMSALGLVEPVIMVDHKHSTLPRAYKAWPSIMTSEHGDGIYYLYAPVSYNGDHFVPADSRLITGEEVQKIGHKLGGGGWFNPISVMPVPLEGVTLPADYRAALATTTDTNPYAQPSRAFVVAGATEKWLQLYQRDMDKWKEAMEAYMEAAKGLVMQAINQSLDPAAMNGDGLYFNTSYTMNNKRELHLSARRDGRGGDVMQGGQPVAIPESGDYIARKRNGGEYSIKPARNPATPDGVSLKKLYDAIPYFPTLDRYGDIAAPNGTVPIAIKRGGLDVLLYHVADDVPDFSPAGAHPISRALDEWLYRDDSDRQMGITPPPMPDSLYDRMLNLTALKNAGHLDHTKRIAANVRTPQ